MLFVSWLAAQRSGCWGRSRSLQRYPLVISVETGTVLLVCASMRIQSGSYVKQVALQHGNQ